MKLFAVFKYLKGYWGYASLNIFFNVLFSVFSVVSIALVIPFMELLFQKDSKDYVKILADGPPAFSVSHLVNYFSGAFNYKMEGLIINSGKLEALLVICIVVFVLTFLKNLFRYFAMYFLAPVRNGV